MKRVGVIANRRYDGLDALLQELVERAKSLGFELAFEPGLEEMTGARSQLESPDDIDLLLTLGGDGTMLRGARFLEARQVPLLGINLGRLGFLTCCGANDWTEALERVARGEHRVEPLMTLEAETCLSAGTTRWRALNDVVLHKGGFARVVRLAVSVDDELIAAFAADGIIVASPTGSTAYNLSAGGPVVVPTVDSIVVTPISAHALGVRPVVLPPTAKIEVRAEDGPEELLVTIDGQVGASVPPGDALLVRRAESPVLIVRFPDTTFFSRMRRKLGWGWFPERGDDDRRC